MKISDRPGQFDKALKSIKIDPVTCASLVKFSESVALRELWKIETLLHQLPEESATLALTSAVSTKGHTEFASLLIRCCRALQPLAVVADKGRLDLAREVVKNRNLLFDELKDAVHLVDQAIIHKGGCQNGLLSRTVEATDFVKEYLGPQVGFVQRQHGLYDFKREFPKASPCTSVATTSEGILVQHETHQITREEGNEIKGRLLTLSRAWPIDGSQDIIPTYFQFKREMWKLLNSKSPQSVSLQMSCGNSGLPFTSNYLIRDAF